MGGAAWEVWRGGMLGLGIGRRGMDFGVVEVGFVWERVHVHAD